MKEYYRLNLYIFSYIVAAILLFFLSGIFILEEQFIYLLFLTLGFITSWLIYKTRNFSFLRIVVTLAIVILVAINLIRGFESAPAERLVLLVKLLFWILVLNSFILYRRQDIALSIFLSFAIFIFSLPLSLADWHVLLVVAIIFLICTVHILQLFTYSEHVDAILIANIRPERQLYGSIFYSLLIVFFALIIFLLLPKLSFHINFLEKGLSRSAIKDLETKHGSMFWMEEVEQPVIAGKGRAVPAGKRKIYFFNLFDKIAVIEINKKSLTKFFHGMIKSKYNPQIEKSEPYFPEQEQRADFGMQLFNELRASHESYKKINAEKEMLADIKKERSKQEVKDEFKKNIKQTISILPGILFLILKYTLFLCLVLFFICNLYCIVKKKLLQLSLRKLAKNNPRDFIVKIYSMYCQMLGYIGIARQFYHEPIEYLHDVVFQHNGHDRIYHHNLVIIFQRAKYSNQQINTEDSFTVLNSYNIIRKSILDKSRFLKREQLKFLSFNLIV
ncbi:MAG: hypothetical protein ABH952_12210 [Candidatus Omnitrophota bacterium]